MDKPKQEVAAKSGIDIWPVLDIEVKQTKEVEDRIKSIMSTMTLEQKVAQMIQPEIRDITVEDMRKYGFGSFLNGGGAFPNNNKQSTPQDWIKLAEDLYQASIDDSLDGSTIPTMWGTDAVHGHNNVIGATLFPHNIGLGAANNPDLIEKIANATATEVMVTGIDWVFAPTVATVRDDRWGRTYESYSEDPEIVRTYAAAIVHGLQGHAGKDFLSDNRVISTVKHFVGDGGTVGGDDQGDNIAREQELFEIHAQGYVGGLEAGAQSVMASFNSWHGEKIHGHKYLLNDVLKDKMGFDGFIVGDWNGHGQVKGCTNGDCAQAANAGLDIYMVPTDAWKPLYENLIKQVNEGIIPMARIDDAVSRILRVKIRAGLFEKPSPANRKFSGKTELIGQESHRDIAKQAVRESLVLLKNKNALLPLNPKAHVLVAGDGADNIGKQSGGWTITWQGTNNTNDDFPGGTSIYDGIKAHVEAADGSVELNESGSYEKKPDVAIVVFGEEPYAEGHGDREHLDYQRGVKSDLAMLKKLKAEGIPVVSLFISGRPLWMNQELNASDAFVAVWLPGSEGSAVADVLFTDKEGQRQYDTTGRLSFSWPNSPYDAVLNKGDEDYSPLFAYGYGLSYDDKDSLGDDLSETYEDLAANAEAKKIFTGTLQKPWVLLLNEGATDQFVVASTAELGAVSYRTVDRNVQEDAFRLTVSNATEAAGVKIAAKSFFREDLSNELLRKSAITFMVKPESAIEGSVSLTMSCESEGDAPGSCTGSVDLTEQLKSVEQGSWATLSVDLQCFSKQGVDFTGLVVPFNLTATGSVTMSISDIAFDFDAAETATVSCN
ncbi:exo 1,3/1,4-beta-D-glucan glucohydrolase [Glaciecola sp. MH2013]|nr:exo 1,3/1,4-beta-D-glucan glucohydrolase [Glaciecola sp. MH2013]MBF7074896.1 exo 1,3/1,4-beta-D-glucan glucohydrolase [Glaciecola sp. MH2013]